MAELIWGNMGGGDEEKTEVAYEYQDAREWISMTHEEQRTWLISQLLEEDPQYKNYQIPKGEQEQKDLLRALMRSGNRRSVLMGI